MTDGVDEFFDREASSYSRPAGLGPFHTVTAQRLEANLSGRVLAIGGPWRFARIDGKRIQLTIVDASEAMLNEWSNLEARRLRGDARALPFEAGEFEHVVLPLVLHHLAGRDALEADRNVQKALEEARRVLRPGGLLWISELTLPRALYLAERRLSKWVRRALSFADIPLVIMHPGEFYVETLLRMGGWRDVRVERVQAPGARALDTITPVIGLDWLRIPRFAYPLAPILVTAQRTVAEGQSKLT